MKRHYRGFTVVLLMATVPAWGQESQTHIEQTQVEQSQQKAAQAWGLDSKEYERFESIMKGPRGTWSPHIDPLTALGLEARTPTERQKYADLLAKAEHARVESELSLQRAYDDAWRRLYPNEKPINTPAPKRGEGVSTPVMGSNPLNPKQRLSVFVATEGCTRCDAVVKQLLSDQAQMDIWVVDAYGKDDRIRSWAAKIGIPPEKVRTGDITLNHSGSAKIGIGSLPRVMPRG